MKRLTTGLVALIALGLLLFLIFTTLTKPSKFAIGPALPPGKVTPRLVSAQNHAVLLAPDGSLWGWGNDIFPPVGNPPQPSTFKYPKRIGSDSDWQKISGCMSHTLALKENGTLWGWGNNNSGQLAQAKGIRKFPNPVRIGTDNDWADISTGAAHCLALKNDGSLWAWGQNESGQVGDGTTSNNYVPTLISSTKDWKNISAGAFNGYALKTNGTVWGWGLDLVYGASKRSNSLAPVQIDADTNWSRISAFDFFVLGLKSDGTLWIRGQNAPYQAQYYVKSLATNFVQIGTETNWQDVFTGAGNFFACKRDGSWWAFGNNENGQLGLGFISNGNGDGLHRIPFDFEPWAFSSGFANTLLLTHDGRLWTWGKRHGSETSLPNQRLRWSINRFLKMMPGHLPRLEDKSFLTDKTPFLLWELPQDIRRNLGTNSIAKDSAARKD